MNYNAETHFSHMPQIDISRSIFDLSHSHLSSGNFGELIPILCEEIYPGDSVRITTNKVVRLQTMLSPIMSNMYGEVTYWFVPKRQVWSHTKEFYGENTAGAWAPTVEYQEPAVSAPAGGFAVGTIADHMGYPVLTDWSGTDELAPSALPLRAYALICNEFWRDENVSDPLLIPMGDENQIGSNGDNYITDVANGGKPFIVAKYHDTFTSALPTPQKSTEPVTFPLLSGSLAPVAAIPTVEMPDNPLSGRAALHWDSTTPFTSGQHQLVYSASNEHGTFAVESAVSGSSRAVWPENLVADLSSNVGAVSINELRLAFQLQRFYERNALYGTRFTEYLAGHFHVTAPDASLQRPEYLGGNRFSINVHEVTNTAQSEQDFLGDLGAKSNTFDSHEDVEKSFSEPGYLIGLICFRYDHLYSQAMPKWLTCRTLTSKYDPAFANLGNVPVYTSEICATSDNLREADVFGYQEAWYHLRHHQNEVTSEMRPGVPNTLASWHLADYYTEPPTLSDAWIREDKNLVDRCLAVGSSVANQVFFDIWFDEFITRALPMYSIPGLIDHN